MLRTRTPGKLQFSVDLFHIADQTSLTDHQQLSHAVRRVATEFAQHRLPLTWAVPSVLMAAAQELFSVTAPGTELNLTRTHDFALLVDDSWPPISNLAQFQYDLQRRLDEADERQVRIGSIALPGPATPAHISAAQACQLRVVRSGSVGAKAMGGSEIRARAAGLLVVESTATLPGARRFLAYQDTGFAAKQALYRAMKGRSNEHITIRMSDLMADPERLNTTVRRIVALTSKLEQAGRIRVGTLRTIALRQGVAEKRSAPARSILRPAA